MAEIYIGEFEIRIEIERALERLLGFRCAAKQLQGRAAIVVRTRVIRLQAQRSVQGLERLSGSADVVEQQSQAVVNERVAGGEDASA